MNKLIYWITITVLCCAGTYANASEQLDKYIGQYGGSDYAPDSTNNEYGLYGSEYEPDSINNPYGLYGSEYSVDSPNNQYSVDTPSIYIKSN